MTHFMVPGVLQVVEPVHGRRHGNGNQPRAQLSKMVELNELVAFEILEDFHGQVWLDSERGWRDTGHAFCVFQFRVRRNVYHFPGRVGLAHRNSVSLAPCELRTAARNSLLTAAAVKRSFPANLDRTRSKGSGVSSTRAIAVPCPVACSAIASAVAPLATCRKVSKHGEHKKVGSAYLVCLRGGDYDLAVFLCHYGGWCRFVREVWL
jgi:hypothetical protein